MRKKVLAFCLVMVLLSCSCREEDRPDYHTYDRLWVLTLTKVEPIENFDILTLQSYYYENMYYYEVTYRSNVPNSLFPPETVYDVLYVFRYGALYTYFPLSNPDECEQYSKVPYGQFLKAKEDGIKREYSEDEIQQIVTDYCAITELSTDD